MSEIDDWGEVIESAPQEGVFDESALGAFEVPAMKESNVVYAKFPQAPKMTAVPQYPKVPQMHGVGDLLDDLATFGAGSGTSAAPRSVTMDEWNTMGQQWNQYTTQGTGGGGKTPTGTQSGMSTEQRLGIANAAIGGVMDVAGGIMGMVTGYQESQTRQDLASQQLQAQMRLLDEQIAASRDSRERERLEAQRASAAGALNSGDLTQILAALQASQRTVPTWVWAVGAVAVLGIGGVVIWKLVSKD
jgi:hypothetical protein